MENRTAKFVSTVFVGILATIALTAIPGSAAQAAGECLSGPKGLAPRGSHWYYRVDRAAKRNCWYVREVGAKPAQTAASASTAGEPEQPNSPKPMSPLQPSVANARAELPAAPDVAAQPAAALVASSRPIDNALSAQPQAAAPPSWSLASRWSNQGNDNDESGTDAVPPSVAQDNPPVIVAADTASAAAAVAPTERNSIWMLLGALASALALAGVLVGAIMKFGTGKKDVNRDSYGRPDIWVAAADRRAATAEERGEPPMNWIKIARERHAAINQSAEIEQLLARAPKRAN